LAVNLWSLAQIIRGWCISDLAFGVLAGNMGNSKHSCIQAFSHSSILAFWRFGWKCAGKLLAISF